MNNDTETRAATLFVLLVASAAFADSFPKLRGIHKIPLNKPGIAQLPIGKVALLGDLLRRQHAVLPDSVQPPLLFEKNSGQADSGFSYVMRSVGFAAGFSQAGMTAAVFSQKGDGEPEPKIVQGYAFQLLLQGTQTTTISPEDAAKGFVNLISGSKGTSRSRIPAYRSLTYHGVYAGTDMIFHGGDGRLKYGFVLEPNAAPERIRIGTRGISSLEVDRNGNLLMKTPSGTIVQTRPRFSQIGPGAVATLTGRFVIFQGNVYGFAVTGRSPGAQLSIDPEIVFESYFGGSQNEGTLEPDGGATDLHAAGFAVAVGPAANLFVVGTTASPDFPATAAGPLNGSTDAFVMRLDPSLPPGHQLVYATFLGGSRFERGVSVASREDSSVYVTGCTVSPDFPPSSPGVVQPPPAATVGYVVRLTPDGTFDIGTRIGKTTDHHPVRVVFAKRASEPAGFVYVAGSVARPPSGGLGDAVAGGFQTSFKGGGFDGFIAKLDTELTHFEYLTYLGGSNRDFIRDLAVTDGFAFVTGATSSLDFPTTDSVLQSTHSQQGTSVDCTNDTANRQCFDAFVTRLNRDGSALSYSTFFGGNDEEYGRGIALAETGTEATVTGAVKPTTGNDTQIFVTRFDGVERT